MSATAPSVSVPIVAEDVLNSRKEIACYLDRGVRTVQRWESELGLPVRRPRGRTRSAVIAMHSDIDHWLKACPVGAREQMVSEVAVRSANPEDRLVRFEIHAHVERSRWLRNNLHQTRQDFNAALCRLISRVEQMRISEVTPGEERSKIV